MGKSRKEKDREWLREQNRTYAILYPCYQTYAQVLQQVLEKAVERRAPLAIVKTRAKSIASFGEKALRKKTKYRDSINRITDLCGARVITPTKSELEPVSEFIKLHFDIDWDNTVDVSQRLKPTEFGYRSIHYIVKFKPGVFPTEDVDVRIPEEVLDLKAEIQVRTILEHAWADFAHDRNYKGAFKIPQKWERELAALAAMLEGADNSFAAIQANLQRYAATYGAYMTEEQIHEEIDNLEIVLEHDPRNVELAARIGKLAITLGDWEKAIDVLSRHVESRYQPILRDIGVAMCKLNVKNPKSREYQKGLEYLQAAADPKYRDPDATASLAGAWKGIDNDKARELYRRAFEFDPSDPYPLGNYLEYEIVRSQDPSIISLIRPVIDNAVQRCRDQADVGMNLPWAFYDMGKFYLLLGMPYESLAAYAKATQLSTAAFMVDTSLQSLEKLSIVGDKLMGHEWAQRFLLVAVAAKFPTKKSKQCVEALASTDDRPIRGPVVIVAGGCDASIEQQMQSYRHILMEAFQYFRGTVISGGTTDGISGLVGDLGQKHPNTIRTIGYVPKKRPADAYIDHRYSDIRETEGYDFSPLEPVQYWTDIIACGISPSQVKLLGINGGSIAAAEYRIALCLGASVAVFENSGREAGKLLTDKDWGSSERLLPLPADAMTLGAFVGPGSPKMSPALRETIASAIHEDYRRVRVSSVRSEDPSIAKWDKLPDYLKESNLQQADHISEKLRQIGCEVQEVIDRPVAQMTFTGEEIESMSEMEHARWMIERLRDGWKWGETRDVVNKISPYLLAWSNLPEEVKEWDRETVRKIPEFLAKVGLEVRRAL